MLYKNKLHPLLPVVNLEWKNTQNFIPKHNLQLLYYQCLTEGNLTISLFASVPKPTERHISGLTE